MARPSKMQLRLQAQRGQQIVPAKIVGERALNRPYRRFRSFVDENDERIAKLDKALKGKQGCNCNVTACQRPNAWFYNGGTRAWYCFDCAWDIRKFNNPERDGYTLFPQWDADLERYETEMRLNSAARDAYLAQRLAA